MKYELSKSNETCCAYVGLSEDHYLTISYSYKYHNFYVINNAINNVKEEKIFYGDSEGFIALIQYFHDIIKPYFNDSTRNDFAIISNFVETV